MEQLAIRRMEVEEVELCSAEGRTLARLVDAPEDVPPFARSMVDGYAVIAGDVRGASRERPVRLQLAGEVLMGASTDLTLRVGQAVAIPTGGALPAGTSGIVKIEDTARDGDAVLVFDSEGSGERITPAASDVRAGQTLFEAGAVLSPAAVGLLAAAGHACAPVYRRPAVAVLVTGDELVPAPAPLRPGQIRESNGVMLKAALSAMGCAPQNYDTVPDEREALRVALRRALQECDAVIISGGSSAGVRDHVPGVVADAGEPGVVVHGVRAKPGRPVLLAMIGDRPVIGLPGNPVSALVMLETLARPILMRMFDKRDRVLPLRARLHSPIHVEDALEHRIPVCLSPSADGLVAEPLAGSSSQLHILAFAGAMIVVAPGCGGLNAGTWVDAVPFSTTRILG